MNTVLAEGTTSIIPADTVSSLVSTVQTGANEILTNGVTMINGVLPYVIGFVGISVLVAIGLRWIRRVRG